MKFRKKPVVIEAFMYALHVEPKWFIEAERRGDIEPFWDGSTEGVHRPDGVEIKTLEGTMRAHVGDWIIRGVKGEIYPCKDDIFWATYEEVP